MLRACPAGVLCLTLAATACGRTPPDELGPPTPAGLTPDAHARQPYFTPGSESYGYYEGGAVGNRCTQDRDCLVTGCLGSTCAADVMEIGGSSFCNQRSGSQWPEPQLAECGCLEGECRWYFENDYDRPCEEDADCAGLGPPPGGRPAGKHGKAAWSCAQGKCQLL